MDNKSPNDLILQFRQMSLPLWFRFAVLLLSFSLFSASLFLLVKGLIQADTSLFSAGTALLSSIFIPVLIVALLTFSETGTKALRRKSSTFLAEVIPEAFKTTQNSHPLTFKSVVVRHTPYSPIAQYQINVVETNRQIVFNFTIELNVSKINLTLLLPQPNFLPEVIHEHFLHTKLGAEKEGYQFNQQAITTTYLQQRYTKWVAIKQLSHQFLWDHAEQLYVAQDLYLFILSLIEEGWEQFNQPRHE